MDYIRKMELMGSGLVISLAIVWANVVSIHPNAIIRIIMFGGLLGVSSCVVTYPLVQSVRIYELEKARPPKKDKT